MDQEYKLEDDFILMESINHFAKFANNESYKYKFIEIMN